MSKTVAQAKAELDKALPNANSSVAITFRCGSDDVGSLHANATAFTSGSYGYHSQGKMLIDGKDCQVNVLITAVGSKVEADAEYRAGLVAALRKAKKAARVAKA